MELALAVVQIVAAAGLAKVRGSQKTVASGSTVSKGEYTERISPTRIPLLFHT